MRIVLGVAAHVDAGKTTLSEQILSHTGVIRRVGRVDHGDAFMDGDALERARGITIFSEQASFTLPGAEGGGMLEVTLMDTPGHVDFSGEMERALSVIDAALLVISCAEGVQSHTVTLFNMLKKRGVPTLIFLNKTDRTGADPTAALAQMHRLLSPDCVLTSLPQEELREELAARDEQLLEQHFDGAASRQDYLSGLRRAFLSRAIFPVIPGSALTDQGVDALLTAVSALCHTGCAAREGEAFSAQVYRVRRVSGTRMTYMKVTSGSVSARSVIPTLAGEMKISALYSVQGAKLSPVQEAFAGQTVAAAGLEARPGEIVGEGFGLTQPELVPVMSVQVDPVPPLDARALHQHLKELEEEDPLLRVRAQEGRLSVGIMGAVQIEVLQSLLASRFGDQVVFRQPEVLYRETIAEPVIGIGHYEPLRHYAEAWLRMSPGPVGSGVTYDSACPPNSLELHWRRLVRTHVLEREHPGVLTGSPITDIHVELIAGRSHLKHTEGGDFREATYRAIRHGLMHAKSVLLEPYMRFELAMPQEALARVTGELLRMGADIGAPEYDGDEASLCGSCTAAAFWDYPTRFAAATRGHGRISARFDRYAPCPEQEKIVAEIGYNPLGDERNPTGSVFCSHGAGFYVAWDHVREWAHCEVEA
ncbi:MAG: TetM/TetW/TetO/TetS family tetracycline resistance ribosomal protection protein [Clostridia bacterium]|nr:TetM/TetW/TetO/TetS family tetracycline resistance ribosomal protection protein [Clostridia bacterium]